MDIAIDANININCSPGRLILAINFDAGLLILPNIIDIHDKLVAETAAVGDEVGIMITTSASLWANSDGLDVAAGDEHEAASEAVERTVSATADDNELEEVVGTGDEEHEAAVEAEERGVSATAFFADDDNGLEEVAGTGDDEHEAAAEAEERGVSATAIFAHVAVGAGDEAEGKIVAAERSEGSTALFEAESEVGDEDEVAVAVVEAARATQE